MKKEMVKSKWRTAIMIIVILAIFSFIISGVVSLFTGVELKEGNVALIPVKGIITSERVRAFGQEVAASPTIIEFIEEADRNPKIEAIILEINSPGGSPVASEEIANAVKKVNKTIVAWVREVGASGGYWVASSADSVVASRMSFTGSIGVIASYLEFSGLLKDYNVSYQRLVSGKYKDTGSPFKPLSIQEERLLQSKIDKIHDYFISEVAENRNLPEEKVREMGTGMFYLGEEAKELGLVDIIGGKDEAIELIEKELNIIAELVEYREERSLVDLLSEIFSEQSFFVGKGIGDSLLETRGRIDIWT